MKLLIQEADNGYIVTDKFNLEDYPDEVMVYEVESDEQMANFLDSLCRKFVPYEKYGENNVKVTLGNKGHKL